MPELPDIVVYIENLESRIQGRTLERVRLLNPFVLRTAIPPVSSTAGRQVVGLRRLGKRIVIELDDDLFLVLHLMVAGRLRWFEGKARLPGKIALAAFDFDSGTLVFTEAGTKRRASIHLVQGEAAMNALHAGGVEVLKSGQAAFSNRLKAENHTLKRALTDPHIFSGIGNAYSDEILHRARLSPVALTEKLGAEEIARLFDAIRAVLGEWTDRLRKEAGGRFPEKVTAFREGMAVHGRYGQPCPVCGALRCSASSTPITRLITAPAVRPAAESSPIAPCRGCLRRAGRAALTTSAETGDFHPLPVWNESNYIEIPA